MTEQLIIDGVTIPVDKGISTVLTFSIKDIQEPDKVKSSFSKTIKLPGSKAINDKLNFVFEVNSDSTFNPNLKLDAVYYQNDIAVFSGFIQLKDIHKKDYNQVEYSVVLFGETANIFRELGNKFLNDAGMLWNELDHDYTRVIQENSWDTSYILNGVVTSFQYGNGLTYPMINYGNDTNISVYNVNEMFPAVYAKEYIDRMFADSGYTYSSNFFNDSLFRHLIIPFSGKEFTPLQSELLDRKVEADTPLFISSGLDNYTLDTSVTPQLDWQTNTIRLSNELVDSGNQYNPATGEITVGANGTYKLSFNVDVQIETTPKAGGAAAGDIIGGVNGQPLFMNKFGIKVNGVDVNTSTSHAYATNLTPAVTYSTANPTTYPDANFKNSDGLVNRNENPPNKYLLNVDIQLQTGDVISVNLMSTWEGIAYADNSGPATIYYPYTDSNIANFPNLGYHADFKIIMLDAILSLNVVDSFYAEGDTINMFSAIPDKVKQRDFLTSIIKMFNLYMTPNENNPKNIIIEPRGDFYTTDILDWSSKLDYSKEMNLTPTAVTNKQKYIYTYKQDADYYNKKYEASWLDIYGSRNVYLENDFNKDEHKTELIFSPTPMVGQLDNSRVVSTIIDVDATLQQKTIKSNIRILYYGGMKVSSNNWIHEALAGDVYWGEYPYAAHFNNPYTPTIDLNFGLPREIYYDNTYGTITITNANLYETYHRKELEQLTDKDSKIFTGYFLLNPVDIANLSFRPSYFFENEYWNLHKVMYSSSIYQPSKCEFLKLKAVPTPTVITEELVGVGEKSIGDEELPKINQNILSGNNVLNMKSSHVDGLNNFIDKSAMFVDIKGDNNKVFTGSKNITIQGDNNVIESNLENISLINTSNVTVQQSNVTYMDGKQIIASPLYGLYSQTVNSATITNSVVETSIVGSGVGSLTVPANAFKVGDSYHAKIGGLISAANNDRITVNIRNGGILLATTGLINLEVVTALGWELELDFTVDTIGATGTISTNGNFAYNRNTGSLEGFVFQDMGSIDTTVLNTLDIAVQWGQEKTADQIYSANFVLFKTY